MGTSLTLTPSCCRLKATLQRLRRLTEGYSSELMGAYTARAVVMGKALGLDADRYNGGCNFYCLLHFRQFSVIRTVQRAGGHGQGLGLDVDRYNGAFFSLDPLAHSFVIAGA